MSMKFARVFRGRPPRPMDAVVDVSRLQLTGPRAKSKAMTLGKTRTWGIPGAVSSITIYSRRLGRRRQSETLAHRRRRWKATGSVGCPRPSLRRSVDAPLQTLPVTSEIQRPPNRVSRHVCCFIQTAHSLDLLQTFAVVITIPLTYCPYGNVVKVSSRIHICLKILKNAIQTNGRPPTKKIPLQSAVFYIHPPDRPTNKQVVWHDASRSQWQE